MTAEECSQYEVHQRDLADDLSLGSLLDELSSRGCISGEHVTAIRQHGGTERQQRARLLDIMARRSLNHYRLFLDVLRKADEPSVREQRRLGEDDAYIVKQLLVASYKTASCCLEPVVPRESQQFLAVVL